MSQQTVNTKGLNFSRMNTADGVSPYDQFKYDYRTSVIKKPDGSIVFEMKNVEVPEGWSQVATDILAQKYFRKAGVPQADGSLGSETSVKQVAHRLAAKPNNKEYGSPTAKANWWADLELSGSVGRSVFWPVPNVDSSLVSFVRHEPLGDEDQRVATFSVIDKAFAKRRKMMRSAVGELFDDAEGNLIAAGVDPTIRGEALAIAQFFQIGKQLIKDNSTK